MKGQMNEIIAWFENRLRKWEADSGGNEATEKERRILAALKAGQAYADARRDPGRYRETVDRQIAAEKALLAAYPEVQP